MAKVTAPLLSLGGSGTIGKSITFGSWRGVQYARQRVVPANPRTTAQQAVRNAFASLDDQYKRSLSLAQEPWIVAARGRPFTSRNAYLSANVAANQGQADMTNFVGSPGVNGGLPGLSPDAMGGGASGEIDASLDVGQNPVDWTPDFVIFTAFPDRDPATGMTEFVYEASEAGPAVPYVPPQTVSHTLTGLTPDTDYIVSMWIQWTRSDGLAAYGVSSTLLAHSTA